MYYLRTRYYDPKIARFISEDTFPGWYTDPLSLNKYTYTHNNPVSYHDPNGTSIFGDIWGGIKKGVSSVGNWVSNNIVKPIKEIFTPKKESSPASVGQNAATNNKYTPTSSGGKKNYSSGSSSKSSSGSSTESSTGYNGISKEAQNSIENAQEQLSALSKGFESGEGNSEISNPADDGKSLEDIEKEKIKDDINSGNSIAGTLTGIGAGLIKNALMKSASFFSAGIGIATTVNSAREAIQNDKLNARQKVATVVADVATFALTTAISYTTTAAAVALISGIWAGNVIGTAGSATIGAVAMTGAIVLGTIAGTAAVNYAIEKSMSNFKESLITALE